MPTGSILVADDDAAIRTVLNQALSRAGYEVRSTGNAATLWRWISQGDGDLVITDVVMPDMSGRQLADRARGKRPNLKVLYTTGYTRNAIVHNGMLDPGTNLLTKPFSIEELAGKIRKILDEGA